MSMVEINLKLSLRSSNTEGIVLSEAAKNEKQREIKIQVSGVPNHLFRAI